MGKDNHIIVDPHHQFGQPVIENTNILAETVFDLSQAGDTPEFISGLYQLKVKEVENAIALFTPKQA
jgi:uncharacterized protein (DUF433 family)